METAGTYKITRAGQITIPSDIRKELKLEEGTSIDIYYDGDLILLRKKKLPQELFDEIAAKTEKRFKEQEITRADVKEAIRSARNEISSS